MKKSLLFMMTLGAMIMVSCSKNNVPAASPEINLNIKISGPGAETKAAKKSWATGDKLNIWFDENGNQNTPDLIITFDGTQWKAGSLRAGCTPPASGHLLALYEGFNDVSSAHYDYSYYSSRDWFSPKRAKERPDYEDSYCRPLIFYAFGISCTFSANTLAFTISTSDWKFQTKFKVLIKTHPSMDKEADYYNLQVINTASSTYPDCDGAWLVYPSYYMIVGTGSSNYKGWTAGVQEADGIAFYYTSFKVDSSSDIKFRIKEYGVSTVKAYTATGKTIDASSNKGCVGIQLDYGNFGDE